MLADLDGLIDPAGFQTGNERSPVYHAGGLWPLWHNITPSEIASNETAAMELFAGVRFVADRYPGPPSVSTLLDTGLSESLAPCWACLACLLIGCPCVFADWDFPNAWPVSRTVYCRCCPH